MKQTLSLIFLLFSLSIVAQKVQTYAPWANDALSKNNNSPTMDQVSNAADLYFSTIDKEKKGSGIKPFERWRYHWSFFLDENGRVQPKENLLKSWEEKNSKYSRSNDASNWISMGPYSHENTASWSAGQGRVNAIAVDPNDSNTLYIGAPAGGIWKSIDAGVNWTPLTDYLPQIGVSGIAVDHTNSDIIYIATGDDDASDSSAVGVWKSTDGGATWNVTGSLTGNPNSMNEIIIHPNDPNTILVATSTGLHKSIDGGTTWVRKLVNNVRGLRMKPNDPTTWYAITSSSFYRSTDSGETFQFISIPELSGSGRIEFDVTPANPEVVYIVKANSGSWSFGGIYKSTDGGTNFTKTLENSDIFTSSQAWFDLALSVSDTDENRLHVGVLNIWSSTDGGDNFSQLNSWSAPGSDPYTHADIHFLRYFNGRFFAGTDGGVYVSDNNGSKFNDLTENLAIGQFYKISVSVQNPSNIAGGLQDNGGYALSDDQWKNYFGADGMDCAVNPLDPLNYFGFTQNGGGLYETKDGGRTRTGGISSPETGNWVTPLVSNAQGEIYAGYGQLYRLQNNSFWSQVSNHSFNGRIDLLRIDPNNSDNIYATRDQLLYLSTDRGVTFRTLNPGIGNINALEISSTDSQVVWIVSNAGVYKIPDITATSLAYESVGTGFSVPSESKLSLKHHARSGNNTLYLGTALGVYTISDDTTDWERFDTNLPNVAVRDLEINEEDAKLIAATYGRGVFATDILRQLPPADVRVLAIQNPAGFTCETTFTPQVVIKNQGTGLLTSATVNYSFDGGANQVYNWNGTLNSEETFTVTLPPATVGIGNHVLNVEVTTSNDAYAVNNTLSTSFKVNNSSTDPTITNSFENTGDELLTENSNATPAVWEIAIPSKTLLNAAGSGSRAYLTSAVGNYPTNRVSYLYTDCYDLTQVSTPVLSFKMAFDIEQDWDYLQMQYSTDGALTWQTLGSASDPNWYNSGSTANGIPGAQWTGEGEDNNPLGGTNATVHDYTYDLSAFSGESNIVFRFRFRSDQSVTEEGVMIDDFVITGILSTTSENFDNSVAIFPNPSEGIFNVQWSSAEETTISAFNYLGQKVFEKKGIEDNFYRLDLSQRSPGLYIVKINSGRRTTTKKVIIQ
jgi:hypothetical protein